MLGESFESRARPSAAAAGHVHSGLLTHQESQIARWRATVSPTPRSRASLFISRHTVEWHLKHVFAKLDISSRTQLPRLPLSRLSPT